MKLDLQVFAGHSVTVYGDAGVSSVSASPNSSVAEEAEVTLTVTLESGKEIDEYEMIAGGVTVNPTTKKFAMGDENVVIFVKTKANNKYQVTEPVMISVNDVKVKLNPNTHLLLTPNGAPKEITITNGGAAITNNDVVQSLIKQGVLVKI